MVLCPCKQMGVFMFQRRAVTARVNASLAKSILQLLLIPTDVMDRSGAAFVRRVQKQILDLLSDPCVLSALDLSIDGGCFFGRMVTACFSHFFKGFGREDMCG